MKIQVWENKKNNIQKINEKNFKKYDIIGCIKFINSYDISKL